MKVLCISSRPDDLVRVSDILEGFNHQVEEVQSAIEGNDVILSGIATNQPYELIVLHHDQDGLDTRELIRYWRSQDSFLPLVFISDPGIRTDQDALLELGLMDCIPQDVADEELKSRLAVIVQSMSASATFRVKASLLSKPAECSDVCAAMDMALDLVHEMIPLRAVAFVRYSAQASEPIVQIGKGLELYDQIWLDDVCNQPFLRIEPILEANRPVFEPSDPPRHIFPVTTSRGWEGLLVYFFLEGDDTGINGIRVGQFVTIADGVRSMLEHVRVREAFRRARESKSEYMTILSQRISQPISNLRSTADLLQIVECDPHIKQLSLKITHYARMAKDVLDEVIELGRIDDGMLVIHTTEMSLRKLLEKLVQKMELIFREKGIEVKFDHDPDEDYVADGDPEKLERVFANLLSNAARFSPMEHTITITLKYDDDGWVHVAVKDEGPGLEPGDHEIIFQRNPGRPFEESKDQGIGLFISRQFIVAHEGQIWVESQYGLGAAFHVRLRPPVSSGPVDVDGREGRTEAPAASN